MPSNPALMNTVDDEMHRELSRIFLDAAGDAHSDIVVLTGDGAAFSAGSDLKRMKRGFEAGEKGPDAAEAKRTVIPLPDLEKAKLGF